MSETDTNVMTATAVAPVSTGLPMPTLKPIEPLAVVPVATKTETRVELVRRDWMGDEQVEQAVAKAMQFLDVVKATPEDMRLTMMVGQLGQQSAEAMVPHVAAFDRLMTDVLRKQQADQPAGDNLLKLKSALDQINPAAIKSIPIRLGTKFLMFGKKMGLPKVDDILAIILERHETVKSTIEALLGHLYKDKEQLMSNYAELYQLYVGMIQAQRLLELDIYAASYLQRELAEYHTGLTDEIARMNVGKVLAAVIKKVGDLSVEENVNLQFFAGAQTSAEATNQQVDNIDSLARIMRNSVLAALAIAVYGADLRKSVQTAEAMRDSISETLASSASVHADTMEMVAEAQKSPLLRIEKLEAACADYERAYEAQAATAAFLIQNGPTMIANVRQMTDKLRARVDQGHDSMEAAGAVTAQTPSIDGAK